MWLFILEFVPQYILATGEPLKYAGINSVGLRRKGFDLKKRKIIKKAYSLIYQSDLILTQAVEKIKADFDNSDQIKTILDFMNVDSVSHILIVKLFLFYNLIQKILVFYQYVGEHI